MNRASSSAGVVGLVVACLSVATLADTPQRGGPTVNFFKVEIDGIASGLFTSASGIGVVNEVTEVREGSSNEVRLVPGRTKFPILELSRRATGARELYDWAISNLTGKIVRRTVNVSMLNQQGAAVAKWTFTNAWPVKWDGPSFDASKNEIAVETIHLAYEGVTMTSAVK